MQSNHFVSLENSLFSGDIVTNLQLQIDQLGERHEEDYEHLTNLIKMLRENKALVRVSVKDDSGKPVSKVIIKNMTGEDGGTLYTNSQGIAQTLMDATSSFKPQFDKYVDIESFTIPAAINVLAGNEYLFEVTATRRNFLGITATGTYYFTGNVQKIGYSLVGGGGGGGSGYDYSLWTYGGGGGGGGGVKVVAESVIQPLTEYKIIIGSGGEGGNYQTSSTNKNGKPGGSTSFNNQSISGGSGGYTNYDDAGYHGGQPGSGGGNGGASVEGYANSKTTEAAKTGNPGTISYYSSFSELANGPGGGGGGAAMWYESISGEPGLGGNSGGGKGGYTGGQGGSATSYGGGGGGGGSGSGNNSVLPGKGGSGYKGYASIRILSVI